MVWCTEPCVKQREAPFRLAESDKYVNSIHGRSPNWRKCIDTEVIAIAVRSFFNGSAEAEVRIQFTGEVYFIFVC